MNRHEVRALFDDALYQVFDNMVFRILGVLIVLFVLPTFLVGFREHDIVLLFGLHYDYFEWTKSLVPMFGPDVQSATVGFLQTSFADKIAGDVGMLFCVVATSFFMPRMLEKGYADTLFSKPVSRPMQMLSRYLAGILFVGLLAGVLIGGQTLGFALVSSYTDPGFLFSVLTLVWLFMTLHAVSILCGVLTRSAIASVMLTIVFYTSCGGVHLGWTIKETLMEKRQQHIDALAKAGKSTADEELGPVARGMIAALDTCHYVLPKTGDAELIAKLFRRQYENATRELFDNETELTIRAAPVGFQREPRSSLHSKDGLLWIAPHPSGGGEARWTLKCVSAADSRSRSTLTRELKKELSANPLCSEVVSEHTVIGSNSAERVEWHEKHGDEQRLRRRWFFATEEWAFTLDYDAESAWAADAERPAMHDKFVRGISLGEGGPRDMVDPHSRDFGWGATWKHNAWFSIATTAAFIALALGLATWRLKRIDF